MSISLNGIEVEKWHQHPTADGDAMYGEIYLDGKKVGYYEDKGDGGEAVVEFYQATTKKEKGLLQENTPESKTYFAEKRRKLIDEFTRRRIAYFTEHPPVAIFSKDRHLVTTPWPYNCWDGYPADADPFLADAAYTDESSFILEIRAYEMSLGQRRPEQARLASTS